MILYACDQSKFLQKIWKNGAVLDRSIKKLFYFGRFQYGRCQRSSTNIPNREIIVFQRSVFQHMSEVRSRLGSSAWPSTLRRRQSGENGAVSSDTAAAKLQSKHNLAHRTRPPPYQWNTLVMMKDFGRHVWPLCFSEALFHLANHWSNVGAYYLSQVKHNKDQISLTTTTNRSEDISQKIETNASMLHAGNWAWMYIMSCFMYQYLWCLSFTAYCLSWFDVMRCRFELNRRQNLCKQQICCCCCCFLIQQQCVITGWRWAAASVPAGEHLQGQQGLAAPCSRRHTPNLPGQTEAWCCFPPSSSLFF